MPSSGLGAFTSKKRETHPEMTAGLPSRPRLDETVAEGESRKLAAEHFEKLRSLVQGRVWDVDSLGTMYPMAVGRPLEPNIEQRQKPPTVS